MSRPELNKNLKSSEFKEFYFLKKELKDFCKKEGLKTSGNKNELEERIIYYLDTGNSLNNIKKNKINYKENADEINLNSKLGENFRCSENKRAFFKKEIGNTFKFKVEFMNWLKSNPNKTYKDAIEMYYKIQKSSKKTKIKKQFQYNQYIRDFFENNKGKKLEDAIKCWNYKKSLKGNNKYDDTDLKVLK